MQKDTQMDIIAEYYMVLGEYTPNERYSESGMRVYTNPETDAWLVLERKGEGTLSFEVQHYSPAVINQKKYDIVTSWCKM